MQRRQGRPNLLDDEFLVNVNDMVIGIRTAGGEISRKMVTAIGTGVIKANCASKLKDFKPSEQFLLEEKVTFQRRISSIIQELDITKELILNVDQTSLLYIFLGKYTFNPKGAKAVSIKGIDDKLSTRCFPKFDFPPDFNVTFPITVGRVQKNQSRYSKKLYFRI